LPAVPVLPPLPPVVPAVPPGSSVDEPPPQPTTAGSKRTPRRKATCKKEGVFMVTGQDTRVDPGRVFVLERRVTHRSASGVARRALRASSALLNHLEELLPGDLEQPPPGDGALGPLPADPLLMAALTPPDAGSCPEAASTPGHRCPGARGG